MGTRSRAQGSGIEGISITESNPRRMPNTGVGARQRRAAAQRRVEKACQTLGRSGFCFSLYTSLFDACKEKARREGRSITPEEVASLMRSCGGCEPWITRQPDGKVTVENDVWRTYL